MVELPGCVLWIPCFMLCRTLRVRRDFCGMLAGRAKTCRGRLRRPYSHVAGQPVSKHLQVLGTGRSWFRREERRATTGWVRLKRGYFAGRQQEWLAYYETFWTGPVGCPSELPGDGREDAGRGCAEWQTGMATLEMDRKKVDRE